MTRRSNKVYQNIDEECYFPPAILIIVDCDKNKMFIFGYLKIIKFS